MATISSENLRNQAEQLITSAAVFIQRLTPEQKEALRNRFYDEAQAISLGTARSEKACPMYLNSGKFRCDCPNTSAEIGWFPFYCGIEQTCLTKSLLFSEPS